MVVSEPANSGNTNGSDLDMSTVVDSEGPNGKDQNAYIASESCDSRTSNANGKREGTASEPIGTGDSNGSNRGTPTVVLESIDSGTPNANPISEITNINAPDDSDNIRGEQENDITKSVPGLYRLLELYKDDSVGGLGEFYNCQ